jgi:ABC-type Fe3+ transport system permease subunit
LLLQQHVSFASALFRSLVISFGSGLLMIFLLALVTYALPHQRFRRFLLSYLAPSTALMGLAWLSFDLPADDTVSFVVILLGLCSLTLPLLYRLKLDGAFHSLSHQIEVALAMGAKWNQIYWKIILPQVWPALCFAASLMAFWAAGEFAFSSLVASSSFSLALLTKSLTDSYRIEAAGALSWMNLLLGLMMWIFFRRLGHVFDHRTR